MTAVTMTAAAMMMELVMIDRLARMRRRLGQLRRDDSGAVAFIFAAMMPAVLGGLALAVDVSLYRISYTRLQAAADSAALAGLQAMAKGGNAKTTALSIVSGNIPSAYGEVMKETDIQIGTYSTATGFVLGGGANANAVRVVAARSPARGNAIPSIFASLFKIAPTEVSVQAIAARPINVFYEPPELTNLDNEAGDFNELYVYCFDFDRDRAGGEPAHADDADVEQHAEQPQCGDRERRDHSGQSAGARGSDLA
ncbi:MAG: pilus assembly protein TadG-related protein [Polymorphobacter sp.]|uniref:pilus assembly protein TadG-related protein n=1 Tax=Polymorphobacter sp. TaxID=1909290 RepID=UPI003A86A27D